jgi:hypothetical protein
MGNNLSQETVEQVKERRESGIESGTDGKVGGQEAGRGDYGTHVSETVLNVFLAPWNHPSGANWFDAYFVSFCSLPLHIRERLT